MLSRRPPGLDEVKSLSGLLRGLGLCALILASLTFIACASASATTPMPNIAIKTLGGVQFWADEMVDNGWRVQCHVWTKHCRVLDTSNIRRGWGSFEASQRIMVSTAKQSYGTDVVLLVHGIARGPRTFGSLPKQLRQQGFNATAISYPSTRATIETHAAQLDRIVQRLPGDATVSFVTHSMGGLVARQLLASKAGRPVGKTVMIAPPNQGSQVAEYLKDWFFYRAVYGTAGQQLVPGHVKTMPVPSTPFGIIAGGKRDDVGYNPWLAGDDDGTVSVAEAKLPGATDFMVLHGLHGYLARSPEMVRPVTRFLHNGNFGEHNE